MSSIDHPRAQVVLYIDPKAYERETGHPLDAEQLNAIGKNCNEDAAGICGYEAWQTHMPEGNQHIERSTFTTLIPRSTEQTIEGAKIRALVHNDDMETSYNLTLPNGVEVNAFIRVADEFPELKGSTVVTIDTERLEDHQPDGDPRMEVLLNDATLYDREEIGQPDTAPGAAFRTVDMGTLRELVETLSAPQHGHSDGEIERRWEVSEALTEIIVDALARVDESAKRATREARYRELCSHYEIEPGEDGSLAGFTYSGDIERYAAVGREYQGATEREVGAGVSTWPTEEEALAALGSAFMEGYAPEAIYDLDTGDRIEVHVANPVVTRSEDQGAMENPLQPEED